MRWLLFVARLAFICNLAFILCVVIRYLPFTLPQSVVGLVVALGYISILINLLLLTCVIIFRKHQVARWLIIFNVSLFVLQIVYFFA